MTRQEVIVLMESSRSAEEWNTNCDKVKQAFAVLVDGRLRRSAYPDFWYAVVIQSGLLGRAQVRWSV